MNEHTDIVDRLREWPDAFLGLYMLPDSEVRIDGRLAHEAAREIERLRAEIQSLRAPDDYDARIDPRIVDGDF